MIIIIEVVLIVILAMILFVIRREDAESKDAQMPQGKVERYWDGIERRRYVRFGTLLDVRYNIGRCRSLKEALSKDISESGMRLLVDKKLERGTLVCLEITPPDSRGPLQVKGVVVWCNSAKGKEQSGDKRLFHIGVKFLKAKKAKAAASFARLMDIVESRARPDESP